MHTHRVLRGIGQFILCCVLVVTIPILLNFVSFDQNLDWYHTLQKPSWNPPDWVFGPVWAALYFLMSLSLWLIHQSKKPFIEKRKAYTFFFSQLILNGLWTPLFFGLHEPGYALLDLFLLLLFVVATAITFFKIRPIAGLLFIPYIAWSLLAFALNSEIYIAN
jgi:tryptophan-rich sensory protein